MTFTVMKALKPGKDNVPLFGGRCHLFPTKCTLGEGGKQLEVKTVCAPVSIAYQPEI